MQVEGNGRLLHRMLHDMEGAPELYRPTRFWRDGLDAIVRDIESLGVESFRRHPSAHDMYVPLYANRRRLARLVRLLTAPVPEIADRLVNNVADARADWRVAEAAETNKWPHLAGLSESTFGEPIEQFEFHGRRFSKSFLNYVRALQFLKRKIDGLERTNVVMEIGGGYGTLGEILAGSGRDVLYVDVDIPPVAYVATCYLAAVLGRDAVCSYEDLETFSGAIDIEDLRERYAAVVMCPWQMERLRGSVDGFVNSISFQEMEPEVVANYAGQVTRLHPKWLLLRNSATGKPAKRRRDLGVNTPIFSADYLRFFDDYVCVAEDDAIFGEERSATSSVVQVFERQAPAGAQH